MEGQQKQTKKKRRPFPWIRAIAALVTSLLLSALAILLILSTVHVIAAYWLVVIPIIFTVFGQLLPLWQWLFPVSTEAKDDQPTTIWNVPYLRNRCFTGREELLKRLHDNFMNRKAAALTQAITGLGGIGKTQIAVEYTYCYRDEYHAVLWVNAATRDTLITSFLGLAHLLKLPEKNERDQNITIQAVKRWLEQPDRWLLIFDSVDDLVLAEDFLPTGGRGHILLTTRAQAVGFLANGIDVEKMDTEEGMLLLLHRAGVLALDVTHRPARAFWHYLLLHRAGVLALDAQLAQVPTEERTAIESIVKEMDGLPLALDQAGAYIEQTGCTVSDYLKSYHRHQKELLEPVATTWSLSLEQAERLNPMAADLLRVCAFLAPNTIPEQLLVDGASELGSHLQPLATDATYIHKAVGVLLSYSLVKRNTQEQEHMLSIHSLLQVVLKENMDEQTRHEWAERTVRAVNLAFPDMDDVKVWEQCEHYLPHALACAQVIEQMHLTLPEAASLLNSVGWYLNTRGRCNEAEPLLKQALIIREQQLGPEHPDTATNMDNLAAVYQEQQKYEQAESLMQQALTIRKQQLGLEHPDTATSMDNLAALYRVQQKYEQAEPLMQQALTIREQQLGLEHPDTAISLNNLALLYQGQKKYEQAEEFFLKALEIRKQLYGYEHPYTATSLNNLGSAYSEQGKYAAAEPLLRQALEIREHLYGYEHPYTATSLSNLAGLYQRLGKYEEAEALYQRALAICEQWLGTKHPGTQIIRGNYVRLLRSAGER